MVHASVTEETLVGEPLPTIEYEVPEGQTYFFMGNDGIGEIACSGDTVVVRPCIDARDGKNDQTIYPGEGTSLYVNRRTRMGNGLARLTIECRQGDPEPADGSTQTRIY